MGRTMKKTIGMLLTVCALAAWVPCYADEPAEKVERLGEIVVTANKYETSASNIPASVTVIGRDQLDAENFPNQDIGDALRSVPGITLRRAYAPFPAYANIRGAGYESTVYLVNGIPTDWQISQTLPVEIVERVEIIRGPASALYGANAGGGVINIILKQGKDKPETTVKSGVGSFDRLRSVLSSEGKVNQFQYALAGYYEEADGTNIVKNNVNPGTHMIDDCDYDKKGAVFNTAYTFDNQAKAGFFYNFFNNRYTRGRPYVGGDWDYNMAGASYDQKIGEALNIHAYAALRTDDYLHLYDNGGTNYGPKQKRFMDYDETPVELQATLALGMGHVLTTGLFYNNQTTDQDYKAWATGNQLYENRFKVQTLAGYLQDVWNITDAMILTSGLRYDHWKNYDNHFSNFVTPDPEDRTDDNVSPRIGLRYNFTQGTSVWTNYGMGFKTPTSEQLYDDRTSGGNPREPNPNLKPEKTHSYEAGIGQAFGKRFQTELVGFYNETDDKIMSWFNASNVYVNKNIGKSRSYGGEFAMTYSPLENLSVNANYTFNIATIEENPQDKTLEGNDLPFSPKHKANIGVTYGHTGNFSLSAGLRYLSRQYSNDANTKTNANGEDVMMDDSYVVDVKGVKHFMVQWGPLKRIDLSLSVDNIFDEEYRTFYMYEDPGTTFFGEVALVF